MGRIFIGEGETLFASEPKLGGSSHPRQPLYRWPEGTALCDIEIRGDDLYVLTQNALYALRGGVRRRTNIQSTKLIWGIPAARGRPGFRNLAWGPEGDLYLSMGDPLGEYGDSHQPDYWDHWTFFSQPAGTKTPYNGVDAVFRCKPDGSNLQVVAGGLRDPNGLIFDAYWNLFSRDGNAQLPIIPHADYGWPRRKRAAAMPWRADLLDPKDAGITPTLANDAFLAPYEATKAAPEKLWRELSDPSWQRRYRAHIEITRRGGDLLKEANKRIFTAGAKDPALHCLIWLAARSQQGSLHLLSLIEHTDPKVRAQAVRALTEYPDQLREEPILVKLLSDDNPEVQHAAMLACFSPKFAWSQPLRKLIERGPACSKDSYLRQTAARLLAEKSTRAQIEAMCKRSEAEMRLAGVLAAGFRLTVPASAKKLERHLPLAKPTDAACIQRYADGEIDLCKVGRIGQYTIAEHWKADMHTDDEELLFTLLRKLLDDEADTVRFQAAYFLDLLKDSRCEAAVARVLKIAR